jgi:hypothetical protein
MKIGVAINRRLDRASFILREHKPTVNQKEEDSVRIFGAPPPDSAGL